MRIFVTSNSVVGKRKVRNTWTHFYFENKMDKRYFSCNAIGRVGFVP